jgi:hypothetical protein
MTPTVKLSLSQTRKREIKSLTTDAIKRLLELGVSHNLFAHVIDENRSDWRSLQDRLHVNYPIEGVGVFATKKNLEKTYAELGGFLHDEQPLAPEEIIYLLGTFPLHASSAVYAFTLLEEYGNGIVNIVNPGYLSRPRSAWHHAVYRDGSLKGRSQIRKARKAFAAAFGKSERHVHEFAAKRLIAIKDARNQFVHEGYSEIDFSSFLAEVIGTVCYIHFLCVPSEKNLKVYPWSDYTGIWTDSSEPIR